MDYKPVSDKEIVYLEKSIKEKMGEKAAQHFASIIIRLKQEAKCLCSVDDKANPRCPTHGPERVKEMNAEFKLMLERNNIV